MTLSLNLTTRLSHELHLSASQLKGENEALVWPSYNDAPPICTGKHLLLLIVTALYSGLFCVAFVFE